MRAVVFGQSGISKDDYLTQEVLPVAQKNGNDFTVINVGLKMHELDTGKRNPERYPSLPVHEREFLRRQALERIIEDIEKKPKKDYILNAHAVFKTDRGLVTAADTDLLKKFNPDIIVVLIDDFHYIRLRLKDTAFKNLSYSSILEWRDSEINSSQIVAAQIIPQFSSLNDWRFFVLARGHNPEVLYRLLYERDSRIRIYTSFAITGASTKQKERISAFKERLAKEHIVFDPYKLAERTILAYAGTFLEEMAESYRENENIKEKYKNFIKSLKKTSKPTSGFSFTKKFIPEKVLPGFSILEYEPSDFEISLREDSQKDEINKKYTLRLNEVQNLISTVDGQILSRDFLLIDQSQIICALVPWNQEMNKPEVSAGSTSEINYANFTGRDSLVLCEGRKDKVSPWIKENATEFFTKIDHMENYINNINKKITKK